MNHNDQTDSLMFDIDNVVRRYKQEFDLNDQAIVGCLEFVKLAVMTDGEILFSPEDIDDNNNDDDIRPHF